MINVLDRTRYIPSSLFLSSGKFGKSTHGLTRLDAKNRNICESQQLKSERRCTCSAANIENGAWLIVADEIVTIPSSHV